MPGLDLKGSRFSGKGQIIAAANFSAHPSNLATIWTEIGENTGYFVHGLGIEAVLRVLGLGIGVDWGVGCMVYGAGFRDMISDL